MDAILKNNTTYYSQKFCENVRKILNEHLDKEIDRPFKYISSIPGKNIRINFFKVINYWAKISEDELAQIDLLIHDIHNASLLLDDIQDKSTLRRRAPCAHRIFGLVNTVNSIDFACGRALEKCSLLDHPKATEIHIESVINGLTGQGLELYWRENCICPTEEEYLKMIMNKTGCVFMAGMRYIKLFSESTFDFTVFSENISLYWQIKDDYQNLTSDVYFDSKGYCEDITEGKFGFPTVHAINTHPEEGKIIMHILRQRTDNVEIKKYCLSLIEKSGSFEYTKQKLKGLENIIREEIERLDVNPLAQLFLERISLTNN